MANCPECGKELESLDLYVEGWKQLVAFKDDNDLTEEKCFNEKYAEDSATAECPFCETVVITTRGERELIKKAKEYLKK